MWIKFFAVLLIAAGAVAQETEPVAEKPATEEPAAEEPAAEEPAAEAPAPLPEVVARVGDQVVTGADFQRDLAYRYALLRSQNPGRKIDDEAFRKDTLEKLVQGMVLRQLAANSGIEISDEDVDVEFQKGRAEFPTDDAYQEHLQELGFTEAALREELRLNLLTQVYLDQKMEKLALPLDEIKQRYDQMVKEGVAIRSQRTADMRHILVKPAADTEEAWAAAREEAVALRDRIVAGEDFGSLAKEYSDDLPSRERGGLYREATEDTVPAEIAEVLRTLEADVISEPIRSMLGWHIVRIEKRYGAGVITFEQAEARVREIIEDEKRLALIQRLVAEARDNMEITLTP